MNTRQIGSGGTEPSWNSDLVRQLRFIKKHLRYPISRRTVWPVASFAAALPLAGFLAYLIIFSSGKPNKAHWPGWLIIGVVLLPAIVAASRYLRTLRFIAVPAKRTMAENMLLIRQFLQANHFAIGRHPEAPEVFQIISRNISALRDEREVVIFIADDGRILVNSHFTQNRFKTATGSPHSRQMARMLATWISRTDQASTEIGFTSF